MARLMERERLGLTEAFERLRRTASATRRKVRSVALELIAGLPPEDSPRRP